MTQTDPALDDLQTADIDFAIESLAETLLPSLRAFYESPEGQAAFEEWKHQQDQQKKPKKQQKRKDT